MVNHHALRTRNAPRVGRCAQARGQAPFPHAGGAISIDGPHTSVSHRQRRGCRRRACAAFPRAIRGHLPADRTGNPVAAGRPAGPDVAGSQRRRKRRRRAAHRPARHRPGEGARPGGRRGVRPPTRAAPTASGRSCWDSSPANLRCLPGWRAYREGTTLSARRRRLWLRTTRSAQPNWRSSTSQGTRRTAGRGALIGRLITSSAFPAIMSAHGTIASVACIFMQATCPGNARTCRGQRASGQAGSGRPRPWRPSHHRRTSARRRPPRPAAPSRRPASGYVHRRHHAEWPGETGRTLAEPRICAATGPLRYRPAHARRSGRIARRPELTRSSS